MSAAPHRIASSPEPRPPRMGYVVIARNGGERLIRSLRSVVVLGGPVVYADSGSTDGGPEAAERLGVAVVRLDGSAPHTAARGRNAGFARLLADHPTLEFVQFVDGDTEILPDWPRHAAAALDADPRLAVVCGRLRERSRDEHIYARLFDMEWDGSLGPIHASGGIATMRVGPFRDAGGFDATLAAGEEGDLCARLRHAGHVIARIDAPMGVHDAAIDRFSQWWRRTARVGHAWAKAVAAPPSAQTVDRRREIRSILFWGLAMPLVALVGLASAWWYAAATILPAAVLAAYGLLLWRIYQRSLRAGRTPADARLYSAFCVVAKWPQLAGAARFWLRG